MRSYIKKTILSGVQMRPLLALAAARVYRLVLALQARVGLCFRYPYVYIASDVQLIGISRINLGKNVVIGSGSLLNVNERTSTSIALSVGENTFIGMRNLFNVGHSIILREYCLTSLNCAFIGSTHCYDNPMSAYSTTGITPNADIYVGTNCFFGYGALVLGNVRIGHGCVIGAGAVVRSNVPPFSLVVGNPARVIKRFDFSAGKWVTWPCENITEGPQEAEYLEHLRKEHGFVLQPLSVASSSFSNIL
jgi:acetyltransferase-like isoleucine patch superfamily enzyme